MARWRYGARRVRFFHRFFSLGCQHKTSPLDGERDEKMEGRTLKPLPNASIQKGPKRCRARWRGSTRLYLFSFIVTQTKSEADIVVNQLRMSAMALCAGGTFGVFPSAAACSGRIEAASSSA
ncbi:hypothetical protein M413DRAFT_347908 [Hebeloma cylindrosporum]|uniref:Uncharacterized protein n=1 Tax=Hebeloma cylindrosporum TaxID=76867 RepID=A0A0C3BW06_HEBCY|nr:hypothetical protein M413DRAFT_347908 [Hebeloma cylindrosporum h7]